MSKADIENVCTLAAHLAAVAINKTPNSPTLQEQTGRFGVNRARDAMKLQRLGRRAHRNAERYCSEQGYEDRYEPEKARIERQAAEILAPYGLTAQVTGDPRGYCLKIMGLPGNTWGGDESGFGI